MLCKQSCSFDPWGDPGQEGRPNFGGLVLGCIEAKFCNEPPLLFESFIFHMNSPGNGESALSAEEGVGESQTRNNFNCVFTFWCYFFTVYVTSHPKLAPTQQLLPPKWGVAEIKSLL